MADTLTHAETHHESEEDLWEGGKQPFKASYGKLMMWYFLLSDAFTFAGFLIAYGTLRIAMPSWPVPESVFEGLPGLFGMGENGIIHGKPLFFVTFMTFVLLFSSYTMVRAVQDGHREYKKGVVFWMFLTILGGLTFLGCQAWEWNTLIVKENMTILQNPFGTATEAGIYLKDGKPAGETFEIGHSYLLHKVGHGHGSDDGHSETGEGDDAHAGGAHDSHASHYDKPGDYADAVVTDDGFILHKFLVTEGENKGMIKTESLGPKAFGALFFFITGFHGFHVLSGVAFLLIIMINVMTGLYVKRRNGYEMVEKIGLYWHFVDLVWVFVFLVFYLI